MKLYHYTPAHNLDNIKEKGLLHFGVGFFTTSEEIDATVNLRGTTPQGRVTVESSSKTKKFSEYVDDPHYFQLFCSYMHVPLLTQIFDTSGWYFTEDEVPPTDIIAYETEIDGIWTKYNKEKE